MRHNDISSTDSAQEFIERVVYIKRVSKVVKGGKRMRIAAGVIVGDGQGKVGLGHGKSEEVALAVRKAATRAKKNLTLIAVTGGTIPHLSTGKYCASKILLKPAPEGTGLIACPQVRSVLEAVGLKDVYTKSLGSTNAYNLSVATIRGLRKLRTPQEIAQIRNKPVEYLTRKAVKTDEKVEDNIN
ncbi:MAG: 30S ribosomal protein S5 [Candidatus Latescibacteria bacterium]|nr:30S ribosomal protein S5 [Candidatus Latescibacterota bacterium]